MNWNEYTEKTNETAVYPGHASVRPTAAITYLALGLAGETGETVDVIKKQWRKGGTWDDPEFLAKVQLELGDIFWYAAQLMKKLGLSFEDVLQANIDKLAQRKAEGTLKERRASGGYIVGTPSTGGVSISARAGYMVSAAALREAEASTRLDGETIVIESAVKPGEVVQPFPARKDFFAALEDLNERDRHDELVDPAERDD